MLVALPLGGSVFIVENPTDVISGVLNKIENVVEVLSTPPATSAEVLIDVPDWPNKMLVDVPFTAQAPIGNWEDERFQNACEEASILMAMSWVRGEELDEISSLESIAKLVAYQQEKFGFHEDTSAEDTAKLISSYFKYENVAYKEDVTVQEIQKELASGNIVIAPVNGQKLNNPYFVSPGPIEHMLVIVGYDKETDEFITNDPGTKRGKNYAYKTHLFYRAMQDYPSGFHQPILEIKKNVIIVSPP